MWRYSIVLGLVCFSVASLAQTQKHFRVESDRSFKVVALDYSASSGTCYMGPGETEEPLAVYSSRDIEDFNYSFDKSTNNGVMDITLSLEEKNTQSFSQSISSKVFDKSSEVDNVWKVFLAEDLPYELDLTFGIGTAFIDLSGISVKTMSIQTGSADVNVGYLSSFSNPIEMEEMVVKVDLGNLNVRQLYKTKAKTVTAEVGFGNMLLDFTEAPEVASHVKASVGAGNLEILIPRFDCPIIIKVKSSMLCDVKLTKSFREIKEDVFVNESYDEDADNLLEFDVDVAMGNIVFREKK
jgi:hypothetical protein